MRYYELVRDMSNKFNLRLEIVRFARDYGISEAAREFKTTRKTVRKWVVRYAADHTRGLADRKRAPHRIPHKMSAEGEARIVALREAHKRKWGPYRLKQHYGLEVSENAIARVIRQKGLMKKRRRKWQRRQDLREKKAQMRIFEKMQVDTKDLQDIPEYYASMIRHRLPRFKYTARDMASGASFFAYANENNGTYSSIFGQMVVDHLRSYGVEVKEMTVQTDNGSEYIGNVRKKSGRSAFEEVLKKARIDHVRIPPRHCTWQSDVERFNGLIEVEFFVFYCFLRRIFLGNFGLERTC